MGEKSKFEDGKLQLKCPSCGKQNAMPIEKVLQGPACGSCKAELSAPEVPLELTDETFDDLVGRSPLPVMVDFWAPWCGPCRMMTPLLESFAKQKVGQAIVAKLNTDENPRTPGKFGIRGIPTLVVFKDGKEVARQVGAVPEKVLEGLLPS